jgi:ribosomal protection tetracycline resistance protein
VGDADGDVSATAFKVERGPAGEKIAYVRMFSGTLRVRQRVEFGDGAEGKVTAIRVFSDGADEQRRAVEAGEIAKLWGLGEIRIGDSIGTPRPGAAQHHFAPPTLETVVVPADLADLARLRVALTQLAEQDPLIDVRQDDLRRELSVSLYGEVQKEVIQATLADEYGLDVGFSETTTICIERPAGTGEAVELLHGEGNPFLATIGLRVEPAPHGSGVEFRLGVDFRVVPLYVYGKLERFGEYMAGYVRESLQEGLFGWQVTDCVVTMFESSYSSPDGPAATRGPLSTAADFRKLTPLVVMQALERAGMVVCEPIALAHLELPAGSIGAVMSALARLGAAVETPSLRGTVAVIEAVLPAARANDLQRQLPGLTNGEGVLETSFGGYEPVSGEPPTRRRTTPNPLNRGEYLMHLGSRF